MKRLRWIVAALLIMGGCGGGGPSEADTKCEVFHGVLCARFVACGLLTEEECGPAVAKGSDCAKATGVSNRYAECLAAYPALSCADVGAGNVPAACVNVIEGDN